MLTAAPGFRDEWFLTERIREAQALATLLKEGIKWETQDLMKEYFQQQNHLHCWIHIHVLSPNELSMAIQLVMAELIVVDAMMSQSCLSFDATVLDLQQHHYSGRVALLQFVPIFLENLDQLLPLIIVQSG